MISSGANFREGEEIEKAREVVLEKYFLKQVVARTLTDTPRRVELTRGPLGLIYKCTCSAQLAKPCKHVVAATLAAWRRHNDKRFKKA
jgi:uncharacterized Zn finger protein